jgi:hypothetical protein
VVGQHLKGLSLPKWPINPPACASYNDKSLKEEFGIHNLLVLNRNPLCTW